MAQFFWHLCSLAVGLFILSLLPLGIKADDAFSYFLAAFILILANVFIRPILILISLPLVLMTLGLFLFVINAIILDCLPLLVHGFHVGGFWGAFFGSILLSIITSFFGGLGYNQERARRQKGGKGEIIDI